MATLALRPGAAKFDDIAQPLRRRLRNITASGASFENAGFDFAASAAAIDACVIATGECLGRRAKPRNQRRRFRAATPVLLLPTAGDQPHAIGMRLDQQRPDAHRPANLVGADRHHIGRARTEFEGQLAEGLHGIDEEVVSRRPDQRLDTPHWLHDTGLVVDPMHGDQQPLASRIGLPRNRSASSSSRMTPSLSRPITVTGRPAKLRGLAHRRVLAGADDDASDAERPDAADNRLRDCLGRRAGEHDLLAVCASERRNLVARHLDQITQGTAMPMHR